MFDWDGLKAFLAVAREGSTLGAAKRLRVNQTTVARRIEALEQDLGLKLFERGQNGSRLTEAGAALICEAERVEEAAGCFSTQVSALQRGLAGSIRVTANESLANLALVAGVAEFRRVYPGVTVELIVNDRFLDLEKGEADIAIRGTSALRDSSLIARKLTEIEWALYASRDYVLRRGWPRSGEELRNGHVLIGGEGDVAGMPGMRWMFEQAPNAEVHCRSNSLTNLVYAVKAGLGVAPLPCLLADHDPELVRCIGPLTAFPSAVWVITRPDLKDTPRVRAFIDFIVPHFIGMARGLQERGRLMQADAAAFAAAARVAEDALA